MARRHRQTNQVRRHPRCRAQTRAQSPAPDLWLVFAATKRARIDLVAEKATELGVIGLQPVFTQHTHVDRVNLERLRAIAIEAAEQSERLTVPEISPPRTLRNCWRTGRLAAVAWSAPRAARRNPLQRR